MQRGRTSIASVGKLYMRFCRRCEEIYRTEFRRTRCCPKCYKPRGNCKP